MTLLGIGIRKAAFALAVGSVVACSQRGGTDLGASIEGRAAAAELPPDSPPTTSAAIALHNLDAEIADRLRQPERVEARIGLVERYLARAQYLGSIGDLERAETTSAELAASTPNDPRVHLARASALGAVHDFESAARELDHASQLGAPDAKITPARASILMATGQLDEADRLMPYSDDLSWEGLEARATLDGYLGDAIRSDGRFELARRRHRDGSPFGVGWMDFERARSLERRAAGQRARVYLAEAVKVLPFYAHAVIHLAALEPPERALAELDRLQAPSDDPEVFSARADALRRLGRKDEATAMASKASARFEEVLAKWPLAFADHAATFFLGMGHDVKRAVVLARQNAANRPTEEAVELWLTAAQADTQRAEACAAARAVATVEHPGEALRERAATVIAADPTRPCP